MEQFQKRVMSVTEVGKRDSKANQNNREIIHDVADFREGCLLKEEILLIFLDDFIC